MKQVFEWMPADNPPECDDYVLLSFDNFSGLIIGRYDKDPDGNGAYYEGDDDRSLVSYGLFVNAWGKLPRRFEE